ncbi:MAG TPA: SIS domain-containing protein, partial [Blastocatellia bacterium]
ERDLQNVNVLKTSLDSDRVIDVARAISRSRKILIVGVDLAASLAYFLGYGLVPLGFDAESLTGSAGQIHHKVRSLTSKDLLIAISFGRCLKQTMDAVFMAQKRGVHTVGITDSDSTPIAVHCDSYLCTSIASPSAIGSYVAPMALMNAIQVTCSLVQSKRSLAMLRQSQEEYTTGDRWYQEPRRTRPSNGDEPERSAPKRRRRRSRPRPAQ